MTLQYFPLDQELIRSWHNGLYLGGGLDKFPTPWLPRPAFQVNLLSLSFGGALLYFVVLHALEKVETALGWAHVLHAYVDALLQLVTPHNLVNFDTDRMLSHVENNSRTAMVVLVGHAFVYGAISLNIDDISELVGQKVLLAKLVGTLLPERTREHVAGPCSVTI